MYYQQRGEAFQQGLPSSTIDLDALAEAAIELGDILSEEKLFRFVAERTLSIVGREYLVVTTSHNCRTGHHKIRSVAGQPERVSSFLDRLDSESSAVDLGTLGDGDPGTLPTVSGVMESTDEDWFSFEGEDDIVGTLNPWFSLGASLDIQICAYFHCVSGGTDVTCSTGAFTHTSSAGRPGCCTVSGAFELLPDLDCTGTSDDSATVYIRLSSSSAECVPYELTYRY